MDDATLQLRGSIVDELQQRITDLLANNQQVPQQYRDMLGEVAETGDVEVVQTVSEWLATLPPLEYKVAEISWQTFALFAQDFIDKTTLAAMTLQLIGGDNTVMVQALKDAKAIRDLSSTPAEAMDKLKAVKQNVSG